MTNKLAGRRGRLFIGGRELLNISQLAFQPATELRTDNFESFVPDSVDLDTVATFNQAKWYYKMVRRRLRRDWRRYQRQKRKQ